MKIHVENILSPYYDVIDKKTGERIRYCIWANDKKNLYKCYQLDKDGNIKANKNNKIKTEKKNVAIKIVRKYSYFHMFFDSMKRILKQLFILYKVERRRKKCPNIQNLKK